MRRFWLALILCLIPLAGNTQPLPSPISAQVNDLAGLLDGKDQREVTDMLKELQADTGIQMTLLTLNSQAPYAPNQSLESFAAALFDDWGIGDATRNDGILVLVLPDDRAMLIELGAGYNQEWNNEADRVIDRSFLPSFRSDKYARGIKDGISDTIATLARPSAEGQPAPKSTDGTWLTILGFIGVIIFAFRRLIGDFSAKLRRCPSCGNRGGLHISREVKFPASSLANESGLKTTRCDKCDYTDSEVYTLGRRSTNSNSTGGGSHLEVAVVQAVEDVQAVGGLRAVGRMGKAH